MKLSKRKKALFSVVTAVLFFGLLEIVLRLFGFEYEAIPKYMSFHQEKYLFGDEKVETFVRDDDLFWRFAPENEALGINAQGFRGEPFLRKKTDGVKRIVCLGCSVTFGIHEPKSYTSFLEERLNRGLDERSFEVYNLGVPGYTSFQGKRILEKVALDYAPDLITILFGWNDHWLMRSRPDHEQRPPPPASRALSRSRIYQLLYSVYAEFMASNISVEVGPDDFRVPLDQYGDNLKAMAETARKHGVKVVFITAPSAILTPADTPGFLLRDGLITETVMVPALHGSYNKVVRETAAKMDAPVADCARELKPRIHELMMDDCIHPNEAGHREIAETIYEELQKRYPQFIEASGREK